MSWGFLCSLDVPTYPRLVRELYNTLEEPENGFQYIVRGRYLYIIKEILARILQTSIHGYTEISFSDKGAILRLICKKEDINLESKIPTSQLPAKMRLLHSNICHILFP